MREAARGLLAALDEQQRALAGLRFDDAGARRWIEYRPESRPGASLSNMDDRARKAAHRLLATGLSPHAYAQAMAIVALEEVLDRREGWRRGRHSNDYWVTVFGDPVHDDAWSWRFEGHHISVTMTVVDGVVSPAPVFFGANPHRVMYDGRAVLAPLAAEEELARALLDAMTPVERSRAIVSDTAPRDIRSATSPRASALEPVGVSASSLGGDARGLLDRIVRMYLARLPEQFRPDPGEVSFAWEGPTVQGGRHYYRIQGDDLLIEYDNTQEDGNHAHTVLRRPRGDFGEDVLKKHLDREHPPM
ncbi:DUF3500 domain-containing protein [Allorhizocola rhizosphaerae]|uniref:DUF3500 domain-containing protein n=1 Tax=Allorhizocola rhizosphaerae TaxID=1872709 RepID=UPI000E3D1FE1|nr:DUF3500 domain-containing protein [Allorhizocola rhizosphaerae]